MNIATKAGMALAVAWQENIVRLVKDGGVWAVPRSLVMIKILHSKKTAVFIGGIHQEPDIVKVFKAMGWNCVDQEPSPADQQAFAA